MCLLEDLCIKLTRTRILYGEITCIYDKANVKLKNKVERVLWHFDLIKVVNTWVKIFKII